MNKRAGPILLLLLLSLVAVPAAKASILPPGGGPAAPDALSVPGYPGGSTLVASAFDEVPILNSSGEYGIVDAIVLSDPLNTFCAGCFDFLYQLDINSGTRNVVRLTATDFTGFLTDVGTAWVPGGGGEYCGIDECGSGTLVNPTTVDRTADGSTVGFNFPEPGGQISPGNSSYVLVIETNATNYTAGALFSIDGGVAQWNGFAPAAFEPSAALLLPVTLLSGGLLRKKLFG